MLLWIGITIHAPGQEQSTPDEPVEASSNQEQLPPGVYRISAGSIESWKVDETTRAVLLSEGAELRRGNERLTASRILGWVNVQADDQTGPVPDRVKLDRLYAETDVLYWKNDEFLQAERLFLNLSTNTGTARKVTYRVFDDEREVPFIVRADTFLQTGEGTYRASGVQFTTCDYAKPHYNIDATSLDIWHSPDGDTSVSASHLVPRYRGIPFGYWPYLYYQTGTDLGPLKEVDFGDNDRFGYFVESLWGFDFTSVQRDEEGNPVRDQNGNRVYNYNLDLDVHLDYRERRGAAIGPELDYQFGRNHEGFFYGYLMNDIKGPNPDNDFDRQFLPQEKEHRGRAWWFHRYDLYGTAGDLQQLRLDTEVNNISDRHFMEEFFEQEFKTGKDRETYTYLRYVDENTFSSFLTRYRLNSFQTQTEYLPELQYSVLGEPIPSTPLVYTSDSSLANVRRRQNRFAAQSDFRTERFDTYQEIAYPFSISFLQARTFAAGRLTQYQDDPNQEGDLTRHVLSSGLELSDQLHRTFPVTSDPLGLNGLRHIFTWDLGYQNNFASNQAPSSTPNFDRRDPVGEHEEVYFELRNHFQTRVRSGTNGDDRTKNQSTSQNIELNRGNKQENRGSSRTKGNAAGNRNELGSVHEFLSLGAAIEHYPDEARDRSRIRAQNHLDPSNWITSVASPSTGNVLDDDLSLLHLDFDFDPTLPFSLAGDYEMNLEQERIEASNTSFRLSLSENLTTSISHSFVRDLTDTFRGSVRANLSDHWSVSGTTSFDLEEGDREDVQMGLGYRLHDFTLRFGAQFDSRRDDRTFVFSISPNFTESRLFDVDIAEAEE